jgi:hypothetical protein
MTKRDLPQPQEIHQDAQGHYATVNGLHMYYEIHGTGAPLVMLHGGMSTIGAFDQILPTLAKSWSMPTAPPPG